MTPSHQITMLKFIKNLSMLSTTLESLHSADAIDFLIELLSHAMKKGHVHFREISNQVLNTMFNLCRLSKERQEYAASNGIIPLLLKIMKTDRPPKEFVLPILCDMAHSGSKGRRYLWQNNGLDFYVSLLEDVYWQVTALDAIFVWLQEETAKVETHLLNMGKFTTAIISCFNTTKANAFDPNLLEPLLKVLRLSPTVAASLAKAEMYAGIAQKFTHKKAVVRLNLLRLVRSIMDGCESHNLPMASVGGSNVTGRQLRLLFDDIQTLADKDSAVLVRNLASELIRSHLDSSMQQNMAVLSGLGLGMGGGGAGLPGSAGIMGSGGHGLGDRSGPRSRSGPRRTTSYTPPVPPSLHSSMSMPQTPTHAQGHRPTHSSHSSSGAAYIEVAATPKRSAVALAHEREAALLRPLSRDGAGGLITNLPRRISGDTSSSSAMAMAAAAAAGSAAANAAAAGSSSSSAVKSRLPRTSTQYASRPSLSSATSAPSPSLSSSYSGGGGYLMTRAERERSNSSVSNKENYGRIRSGSSVSSMQSSSTSGGYTASPISRESSGSSTRPSTSGAAFASRETSVTSGSAKRRNSRAPSTDLRWS